MNFNDMKSRRDCSVEITSPLNCRPHKRSPITGQRIDGVSANLRLAPPQNFPPLPSPSRSHLVSARAFVQFLITFSYKSALDSRMQRVGIGAGLDKRLFARRRQSALLETDLIPPSAAGAPT